MIAPAPPSSGHRMPRRLPPIRTDSAVALEPIQQNRHQRESSEFSANSSGHTEEALELVGEAKDQAAFLSAEIDRVLFEKRPCLWRLWASDVWNDMFHVHSSATTDDEIRKLNQIRTDRGIAMKEEVVKREKERKKLGQADKDAMNSPRQTPSPSSKAKSPPTPEGSIALLVLRYIGARLTVIYSHGTSEDLGTCLPYMKMISHYCKVNVILYDYRGYGVSSSVQCSEASTREDLKAVIRHAREVLGILPESIVLFGRSLGTGVSCQVASEETFAAVILQSGFTSIVGSRLRWPALSPWTDMYRNIDKVTSINAPIFVIHGTKDSVTPFRCSKALYIKAKIKGGFQEVKKAGHNNLETVFGFGQYCLTLSKWFAQTVAYRNLSSPSFPRDLAESFRDLYPSPNVTPSPEIPVTGAIESLNLQNAASKSSIKSLTPSPPPEDSRTGSKIGFENALSPGTPSSGDDGTNMLSISRFPETPPVLSQPDLPMPKLAQATSNVPSALKPPSSPFHSPRPVRSEAFLPRPLSSGSEWQRSASSLTSLSQDSDNELLSPLHSPKVISEHNGVSAWAEDSSAALVTVQKIHGVTAKDSPSIIRRDRMLPNLEDLILPGTPRDKKRVSKSVLRETDFLLSTAVEDLSDCEVPAPRREPRILLPSGPNVLRAVPRPTPPSTPALGGLNSSPSIARDKKKSLRWGGNLGETTFDEKKPEPKAAVLRIQ